MQPVQALSSPHSHISHTDDCNGGELGLGLVVSAQTSEASTNMHITNMSLFIRGAPSSPRGTAARRMTASRHQTLHLPVQADYLSQGNAERAQHS